MILSSQLAASALFPSTNWRLTNLRFLFSLSRMFRPKAFSAILTLFWWLDRRRRPTLRTEITSASSTCAPPVNTNQAATYCSLILAKNMVFTYYTPTRSSAKKKNTRLEYSGLKRHSEILPLWFYLFSKSRASIYAPYAEIKFEDVTMARISLGLSHPCKYQ